MISAQEALRRLREGNERFASGAGGQSGSIAARRKELVAGQKPWAIILGCADSRVPVELVFDQGLGDLFVVRVAGNIAGPSQIGSIELAAEEIGTQLIAVLGHSQCGAVAATFEEILHPAENLSEHLRSIVERVRPSVEPLLETEIRDDPEAVKGRAVRANVLASMHHLTRESETLRRLVEEGKLLIVGAEYSLETGVVDFFEGVSEKG